MAEAPKIYGLIAQAIGLVGPISKDKTSKDRSGSEQFKYRGIDQVYNTLNPIFSKLGIFFCPEVIDQKREDRVTRNGGSLRYTILTVKYTVYASDGSSIVMIVPGEAMDSGDKSTNKAMSVAMKYAIFQLFCIPTEDISDPDSEVHNDVLPPGAQPNVRPQEKPQQNPPASDQPKQATSVEKTKALPSETKKPGVIMVDKEVLDYISNEQAFMAERLELTLIQTKVWFQERRKQLIESGTVKDIPMTELTMDDAKNLVEAIYANFMSDKRNDAE